MTNFPNWNPVSNTDEIRELLLGRLEDENQPQTDVEQDVSKNPPKGINNTEGNLDLLSAIGNQNRIDLMGLLKNGLAKPVLKSNVDWRNPNVDTAVEPSVPVMTPFVPFVGTQDANGNMHYDINSFKQGSFEQRFGINEVPANCAEVQVDYKDGEPNCVKFLDKDGNCIGHMYTKDQVGEDGSVKDDAKANNIILYDNAATMSVVLNPLPPLKGHVIEMGEDGRPYDRCFTPQETLKFALESYGLDDDFIANIMEQVGDAGNYAIDENPDGSKCLKILTVSGVRIGHMYFDSSRDDNNQIFMYWHDPNAGLI